MNDLNIRGSLPAGLADLPVARCAEHIVAEPAGRLHGGGVGGEDGRNEWPNLGGGWRRGRDARAAPGSRRAPPESSNAATLGTP